MIWGKLQIDKLKVLLNMLNSIITQQCIYHFGIYTKTKDINHAQVIDCAAIVTEDI